MMNAQALQHLMQTDRVLGRLIKKVGTFALKPKNRRSPFEALVQSVAYQQLNGTAAATILGRVKALYPGKRFPSPEDLLSTPTKSCAPPVSLAPKPLPLRTSPPKQS